MTPSSSLLPSSEPAREAPLDALCAPVAAAYVAYAALFTEERDRGREPLRAEEARQAWSELQRRLAEVRGEPAPIDQPERRLAEALAALLSGLAGGHFDSDLAAAAGRAVALASLVGPDSSSPLAGRRGEDILYALPRRPAATMASLALSQGLPELALELVAEAGWDEPGDLVVRFEAEMAAGRSERAAEALARLRERSPASSRLPELHSALSARVVAEEIGPGDPLAAVHRLRLRLAIHPRPELSFALGLALRAAGRPVESLQHLAAAGTAHPEVLVELGRTRLQMLDLDAAAAFFAGAVDVRSTRMAAILAAAVLDRIEGRPGAAAERLATLAAECGAGTRLLVARAAACLDLEDPMGGLRLLDQVGAPGRQEMSTRLTRVHALRLTDDHEAARAELEAGLASAPGSLAAVVEMGLLETAAGHLPEPMALVQEQAEALLRPQEIFHLTSVPSRHRLRSRRFLDSLTRELAAVGLPVALAEGPTPDHFIIHLENDRPLDLEPAAVLLATAAPF